MAWFWFNFEVAKWPVKITSDVLQIWHGCESVALYWSRYKKFPNRRFSRFPCDPNKVPGTYFLYISCIRNLIGIIFAVTSSASDDECALAPSTRLKHWLWTFSSSWNPFVDIVAHAATEYSRWGRTRHLYNSIPRWAEIPFLPSKKSAYFGKCFSGFGDRIFSLSVKLQLLIQNYAKIFEFTDLLYLYSFDHILL